MKLENDIEWRKSTVYDLRKEVEYNTAAIVDQSILVRKTESVILSSFSSGEEEKLSTSPFDRLIHVITGSAVLYMDQDLVHVASGQVVLIQAHSTAKIKANTSFKAITITFKSNYFINPNP